MKYTVCLYMEHQDVLRKSGIGTAFNQQKKALEKAGVNYTTDINDDFDILHINFIGLRSLLLARKLRKKGIKIVMHTHTTAEDMANSFRLTNIFHKLIKKYLRFYYSQADLLISPSEYTKRLILGDYVHNKPVIAISNGVDLEKFRFSKELRDKYRKEFGYKGEVIFSVGHIFKRKGVRTFLKMAKKLPENKFAWFGRKFNSFLVNTKKLLEHVPKNVTFYNYVEDIVGAYCAGDVFLFPSYSENQGIVLLEASATNHPLIVRDLPTYKGWLVHKENALICKNDKEFYENLNYVLKDKKLKEKLTKNAHKMVQQHDLKLVGLKLKEAYESLL